MSDNSSSLPVLRVGIIGCGWFGRVHMERLSEIPGVTLTAVSDPDTAAMQNLIAKIPAHLLDPRQAEVGAYPDYHDLLKHPGIDFVSINSPNKWHVQQLLAALENGLHVLCEKPLSLDPEEVRQAVAATRASGKTVAVSYQSRYRKDSRLLRRAIASGKWGRVTSINVFASEDWITPNVGTWRHDPARCLGGYFGDANGHQLDVLFWMTGLEADWVRASNDNRGTPVPMVTWGEAGLVSQGSDPAGPASYTVPMTFLFAGDGHHWREEISIQTEGADFVMRNTQLLWTDGSKPLAPFDDAEVLAAEETMPDLPDKAMVATLRGGSFIASAPETVWPVLRFTLAALESADTGSSIQRIDRA